MSAGTKPVKLRQLKLEVGKLYWKWAVDAAGWDPLGYRATPGEVWTPLGLWRLGTGCWGFGRWIFSLICRGKRMCLPRYWCEVLKSSTEMITEFWKFPCPVLLEMVCVHLWVYLCVQSFKETQAPQRTSLLRTELFLKFC